ncbi:MAG: very short patch repair endonuclease [Candidatus Brocadia sp.]|jgi:DNA mismatch endonuclease Vsr|uniref:Very short patch repair endonuclease n=1 Tax=Candidatus Brocadia fulgida TaxID=380242 RepID=A0A0M2UPD8_9BACT|nr:MAG: very short patch repair endonuclease [Candidatus Brocadia fulgida]UJS20673.1 MAG: very short patch repair endonuclease [Candidatus Brocadia sp.]
MDTFSSAVRSRIMARVRSQRNRSTELKIIEILKRGGLKGWRRNSPLHGKPDFIYPKQRIALFVDGCFWHGCPKCCRMPSAHRKYWVNKIERNKNRDKDVTKALKKKGWKVIRIWEHEISAAKIARKLNILSKYYKT